MYEVRETVIEHCDGDAHATVTAAERNMAYKIRVLAEKHPDDVHIIAENHDGSLMAHVPFKWVKISPPRRSNLTDEQKKNIAERLAASRKV